jgi:hypothetical protein
MVIRSVARHRSWLLVIAAAATAAVIVTAVDGFLVIGHRQDSATQLRPSGLGCAQAGPWRAPDS